MSEALPEPSFLDPANAASWSYRPDEAALPARAAAYRREHGILPASRDARRTTLLLIDVQRDFCFPEGTLYVGGRTGRGAIEDSARIAAFLYRNLARITETVVTLDTHHPFQIFFPSFWVDASGEALAPHRVLTTEDVRTGRARPHPELVSFLPVPDEAWLARQVRFYCEQLEKAGRYQLYLWPPHCILGGEGHTLVGAIHEARMFHAYARLSPARVELKGSHPLTENYSVLSPEVLGRHDGGALAERNTALMDRLLASDALVVAGQASSHCVKSTVDDLLDEILRRDSRLARKVYVLTDGMSAVAVPDAANPGSFLADFTGQTEAAMATWAEAGMHLVRTTDPMESWPGM